VRHHPQDGPILTICTALEIEARAVRRSLPNARILVMGMGGRRLSREMNSVAGPVVVAGFCGALDPELASGDVIVATEVRGPTGTTPCPAAPLLVAALRSVGVHATTGPIVTAGHIVDGEEREALAATGAIGVDMESADVAELAAGHPFAAVRVVVDSPRRGLFRPSLLTDGLRALRVLHTVAEALDAWSAALGDREVVLAGPRSFCAGVERAIEIVERALERNGPPVYVRKQIVHNAHVVRRLEQLGAVFVDELDEVPTGATVVFSAHGVSPQVRADANRRQLDIIDATCPLVAKVHAEARRFAGRGDTVVLIGHSGHEEVEGTLGEAPDNTRLVGTVADVERLEVADPDRVSYVMQTTLAVDEAADVVAALRERFPRVAGPSSDDICYATTNRQDAVRAVITDADLLLVVGSTNSSNSMRLVEIAERAGLAAYLVDDASRINPEWLAGRRMIALTAGASAPQDLVDEVVAALGGLGRVRVSEHWVATETLSFTLPKEVV
jgi:4-hydroxy-3-methylbut-2-enyl diphosphate reductase